MRQETMDKYKRAKEAIDGGKNVAEAVKEQQMSYGSYLKMKAIETKSEKKAAKKLKTPKFIDIPQVVSSPRSSRVFVVVCSTADIKNVIGELAT